MILKRIVYATHAQDLSLVPAKWLTKIFVGGDVACFVIQAAGGGVLSGANSQNDVNIGESVILAGLVFQIVVFAFFIVVAGTFHVRLGSSTAHAARANRLPWQRYLLMLYAVSILVTTRNAFRVTEYAMGSNGYLLTHEWSLYAFDAALMTTVLSICITWYSCRFERVQGQRPRSDVEGSFDMEAK